ncbi:hypothetical protein B0A49_00875 [Cryomyces minteri]|uniref:Clock-controlled protein 8 n=3 Tax=Cryomyces minteri TaxID=331657 RepID=A0A4U0XT52_9PEZI|nr:hypothetical protein B0A49_00875 [Cryomyces minteri]
MEVEQESPPAYRSHDPELLDLPSVPRQQIPFSQQHKSDIELPELRTLLAPTLILPTRVDARAASRYSSGEMHGYDYGGDNRAQMLPVLAHADSAAVHAHDMVPRTSEESVILSPAESTSAMSIDERSHRSTSVVSTENVNERIALEALSGLRNDVRSPSHRNAPPPARPIQPPQSRLQQREPILTLLAESHPWVGGTINGSLSAYETTKSYSPRFIQNTAEFVERNIGSPVANTVGAVGRRTGVEGGIRRYLGDRRPGDADRADPDEVKEGNGSKRRRLAELTPNDMDIEQGLHAPIKREFDSRRESQNSDSLPAYDNNRSPQYTPMAVDHPQRTERPAHHRSWSSKLMIGTSGLGAALSETSLRSLRFCLGGLRHATEQLRTLMKALKLVLEDYDRAREEWQRIHSDKTGAPTTAQQDNSRALTPEEDQKARHLADRIKKISDDIWQHLKNVVNSVSQYTGGALPETAGALVRRQLMSVPVRWRIASESTAGNPNQTGETSRGAARMLAFAEEGLDMMGEVSSIVGSTIESAEQWLNSFGRPARPEHGAPLPAEQSDSKDEEMTDGYEQTIVVQNEKTRS